jgi:sulfate adenylyltransferase
MKAAEFDSVVETLRLPSGAVFSLPIYLDVPQEVATKASKAQRLELFFEGKQVGWMDPEDVYEPNKEQASEKLFGTRDLRHPGVKQFLRSQPFFIGGTVKLLDQARFEFSEYELTPATTKAYFKSQGWNTVVGFQTRNVPHKAHEYLLRLALEMCDGLFIQPLIGWKRKGDYSPEAVIQSYQVLISQFLPMERIQFGVFSAAMRYAGPREAVFHAIVRRNYGCTHFIVGRDHAGVGGYYEKYAAQNLAQSFGEDLGITILPFAGPFYCERCGMIVSERTCTHASTNPELIHDISGTDLRRTIVGGQACDERYIRPEIIQSLQGLNVFIEQDEHEPR